MISALRHRSESTIVRLPSIGKFGASLRVLLSSVTRCYPSIKYISCYYFTYAYCYYCLSSRAFYLNIKEYRLSTTLSEVRLGINGLSGSLRKLFEWRDCSRLAPIP